MIKRSSKFIIQLGILSFFIWLVYFSGKKIEQKGEQNAVPKIIASQYPDYDKIRGEGSGFKVLIIAKDKITNFATKKEHAIEENYIIINGKIKTAYLYIDALVDYKRSFTKWDNFYFRINKNGGHLISDNNRLSTPFTESSVFLYNMESISYYENTNNPKNIQTNINFFDLLQPNKKFRIKAYVSSVRKGRVINELSIYYECDQSTPDCSIESV